MASVSDRDRALARKLPDKFVKMGFPPTLRIMGLVDDLWKDYPDAERRQLEQVLLMLLEPLAEGGAEPTDNLRDECEAAVTDWLERQEG